MRNREGQNKETKREADWETGGTRRQQSMRLVDDLAHTFSVSMGVDDFITMCVDVEHGRVGIGGQLILRKALSFEEDNP